MGADVLDAAALTDPRGASRFARWPAPVALAALAGLVGTACNRRKLIACRTPVMQKPEP